MVWIRLVSTPPGDAPEEVRRAWVGLELPLAGGSGFPWFVPAGDCTGLTAGRRSFRASLWSAVTQRWVRGYLVHAPRALALLAEKDPTAVRWWRDASPSAWKPGRKFTFPRDLCVEIPDPPRPATQAQADPLRRQLVGDVATLALVVWLSALVTAAGVAVGALAFLQLGEELAGPGQGAGLIGLGIGLVWGGGRNLVETWRGYRKVRGARRLLHEYRASLLGGVEEDLDDVDTLEPYMSLTVLALSVAGWLLLRPWVSDTAAVLLAIPAGLFFLVGGLGVVGWALDRRGAAADEDGPDSGALPPGLTPRVLLLIYGAWAGTLLMLLGAARLVHGLVTGAAGPFAILGGLEVGLGGLLTGGLLGLPTFRRAGPTGGKRSDTPGKGPTCWWPRWPEWSGWQTVMEAPAWTGFDTLTVAWVVLTAVAACGVLAAQRLLPWMAAYALQYLALTVLLKGGLFVWIRHVVRQRRRPPAA
jgi:hypothetical protein